MQQEGTRSVLDLLSWKCLRDIQVGAMKGQTLLREVRGDVNCGLEAEVQVCALIRMEKGIFSASPSFSVLLFFSPLMSILVPIFSYCSQILLAQML